MSCVNTLEHFMQIERFYMSCNVGERGFNGAGVNILNIQIPARMLRMFTPAPLNSVSVLIPVAYKPQLSHRML